MDSWPDNDKSLWEPAFESSAGVFEDEEDVEGWKPQTILNYTIAYTYGLNWLRSKGRLHPSMHPGSRWTPELLDSLVSDMQSGDGFSHPRAEATIRIVLVGMSRVLSKISGKNHHLELLAKRYRSTGDATDKLKRLALVDSLKLRACGNELMQRARAIGPQAPRNRLLYRTGLQIFFLAQRPLRLADFAGLSIGKTLVRRGLRLHVAGNSSKTMKSIDIVVPDQLSAALNEYATNWRPLIHGGRYNGSALWVSSRGGAQGMNSIYKQVTSATLDAIGVPISPHLFRDSLATTIGVLDPENSNAARRLLEILMRRCSGSINTAVEPRRQNFCQSYCDK